MGAAAALLIFFKKVFCVWCSACIYVRACVCLMPIASKARRSCIPLAGSRTCSTETVVSLLLLHYSLPFLNASQIGHLTTVSSGQLFSVCSGDAHYHPVLEQFPSQGTVMAMEATGQRVLGKRKILRAQRAHPQRLSNLAKRLVSGWSRQALLQRSCLGNPTPCAVLAREVPKPTPAGLRSPMHLSREVPLLRTFIQCT